MRKTVALIAVLASALPVVAGNPEVRIAKYRDGKAAAVSFTYDDGIIDHYTLVAPHLEKAGMRGTFWIIGEGVSDNGLSWDMLKEMSDKGHEISNHTWSHKRLTELSDEELSFEIHALDDTIEAHTGKRPKTIAFPFNAYDERVLAEAAKGRVGMRLYQTGQGQGRSSGKGSRYSTLEDMKAWLQEQIDGEKWGVTMTHGINVGWDTWEDPQVYWDFISYCKKCSGKVWFGTFEEVASYVAERDACTLSIEQRGRKTIVTPTCTLDPELYKEPLTLEVKVDGVTRYVDIDPFEEECTIICNDQSMIERHIGDGYKSRRKTVWR